MSFIRKSGPKHARCNNEVGNKIKQALAQASSISTSQIKEMFDEEEQKITEPVSAVLAGATDVFDEKNAQKPMYSELAPCDYFGMAEIMAGTGMDTHGRLSEERVIKWWRDVESRFTMGLVRALFFALGVS